MTQGKHIVLTKVSDQPRRAPDFSEEISSLPALYVPLGSTPLIKPPLPCGAGSFTFEITPFLLL